MLLDKKENIRSITAFLLRAGTSGACPKKKERGNPRVCSLNKKGKVTLFIICCLPFAL
jgi:hypothetical protein